MTQDDSVSILLWREYLGLLAIETRLKLEAQLADGLAGSDARRRQVHLEALQIVKDASTLESGFEATILDAPDALYDN